MNIRVIFNENKVIVDDFIVKLTPTQMDIFDTLFRRRGHTFLYDTIIRNIYGVREPENADAAIKTHVCHLNHRLGNVGIKIENVHGRGYKISDPFYKE